MLPILHSVLMFYLVTHYLVKKGSQKPTAQIKAFFSMWFCPFRTEKKSTIINLRLSLNSILWLWRRICMKKILNQAKQISPKWLNSPVKEQRPDSFKGFFPVLLKLPLEGFNFDKKNPQKRQFFFLFPAEDNNPFCDDAVWEHLQTAVIFTSLFLQ